MYFILQNSNDRKRMKLQAVGARWQLTSFPPEPEWSQHPDPDRNSTTLEVSISEEETIKIELDSHLVRILVYFLKYEYVNYNTLWFLNIYFYSQNLDHLQNWSVEDFISEYL